MSEHPAQHLADHHGIHQISLPNPFSTVESNCYFIEDSNPTLIDTGIASEEAYQKLSAALAQLGWRTSDIKRIYLTHGHADHRALAPRLQEETGAEVFYHQAERIRVLFSPHQDEINEAGMNFFRSLGVPELLLKSLVEGPQDPPIKPKLDSASALSGGEQIPCDSMQLQVIHSPGHSSGSTCFFERDRRILFSGDTTLPTPRITALIGLDRLPTVADNPLKQHLQSLRCLEGLEPKHVLPGHGDIFSDYLMVHEEVRERHRKRRNHILRALRHEPKNVYEICRSVFMFSSPDDLYLALSDVFGNIGILLDERRIRELSDGNVPVYERT